MDLTPENIKEDRKNDLMDVLQKHRKSKKELKKQYKNPYGYREALHTGFMLEEIVNHYLLNHPCVILDKEAYEYARLASEYLFCLYQRLGRMEITLSDKKGV